MPTNVTVLQRNFSKIRSPPGFISWWTSRPENPVLFLKLQSMKSEITTWYAKAWMSQVMAVPDSLKNRTHDFPCFHIHDRSRTKCSIYREKRQVWKNRAQRRGEGPIYRNENSAFLPKLQVDRIVIETRTENVPTWRYEKVRVFQEVYDIH